MTTTLGAIPASRVWRHGSALALAVAVVAAGAAHAQPEATTPSPTDAAALAKATQNPVNGRPMNRGVQYRRNVESPIGSAGHQVRFIVALLYPQRTP